jgi:Raf kinase inhibitor-like YbhB/YbcL family protein
VPQTRRVIQRLAVFVAVLSAAGVGSGFVKARMSQGSFRLTSADFANGTVLPKADAYAKNSCGGQDISPELQWTGVPKTAHSLALVLHDPDARPPKGWTHWVVYAIAPTTTGFPTNGGHKKGPYIQGKSSFGTVGYSGPCPPIGDPPHHYVFTLYAVDLPTTTFGPELDRDGLLIAITGHALDSATLTGLYQRK